MNSQQSISKAIPRSGRVIHHAELCRSCGICELGCSAYHDGVCSSYLSRIHLAPHDLDLEFPAVVCSQCSSPSCYHACPLKDEALCIDEKTGARYINEDACTGCEECADACPLPEKPIWQRKAGNGTFFKCDLCKSRKEGPLCIEMCPRKALTFVKREK